MVTLPPNKPGCGRVYVYADPSKPLRAQLVFWRDGRIASAPIQATPALPLAAGAMNYVNVRLDGNEIVILDGRKGGARMFIGESSA